MALRLSTAHVTWALLLLWLAAVAATAWMRSTGPMQSMHYAPVAVMTVLVAAWPFVLGWRPWRARQLRTCASCGTQWLPMESASTRCPACGS